MGRPAVHPPQNLKFIRRTPHEDGDTYEDDV